METILKYWYIPAILVVVGGFFLGKNWDIWFPSDAIPTIHGDETTRGRLSGNAFPSNEKSNGCNCVAGYISNYGIGSNVPCSSWSKYCSNSPN